MNAHFPNPPPPWSPCRNHSYRVPAGVVLLFKGTMTPGHFRLPCSAPPRPYRALVFCQWQMRPQAVGRPIGSD